MLYIYWKCKLNRKFVDKKKNHYIKEMADNVFSTCLCITILRLYLPRMRTIYEPSYLLHERATFQPKMRITADGGALSPIQPL